MSETLLRPCAAGDFERILAIVNAAAEAYRGVIPDDCFHDPYMPPAELASEIAAGVRFWGAEAGGALVGVMGVQPVRDVVLIRHAYVMPNRQRGGLGGALLDHVRGLDARPHLVGTWADADWAIDFYQRHGFALAPPERTSDLLHAYWTIPDRQAEVSVVLSDPPM